jgi:hypothetical protein
MIRLWADCAKPDINPKRDSVREGFYEPQRELPMIGSAEYTFIVRTERFIT